MEHQPSESEIYRHPLHYKCEREFLSLYEASNTNGFSYCYVCWNHIDTMGYGCDSCDCRMHTNCALMSHNGGESEFKIHQHKLLLIQNHKDEAKKRKCDFCLEPLLDSIYVCVVGCCVVTFHEKCIEILHPLHGEGEHSLILSPLPDISSTCHVCHKHDHSDFCYSCSSCDFWIHTSCALEQSPVLKSKHHVHPFVLCVWRQHPFICDACGIMGDSISYACIECNVTVHKECISLPHLIELCFHPHPLIQILGNLNQLIEIDGCRICHEDVRKQWGSYKCLNRDCNYSVHLSCATMSDDYYHEIEKAKILENSKFESCITCVINEDGFGNALEIIHSFHEHPLLFLEKYEGEEDDSKQCDGCLKSVSTSFYHCSRCDFFLHRYCANLPKKIYHQASPYPHTLVFDTLKCISCNRVCCGFFYGNSYKENTTCIQCVEFSSAIFKPAGHEHSLFDDALYKGRCRACDEIIFGAYKCKFCTYALCYACISLPIEARHKFDKHAMRLSYHDEDDPTRNYCDICEEKRDTNLWFYHCSICDNSAHLKCVLGEFPKIKTGSIYQEEDLHPHPLTFVRKIYLYPKCHKCGEPCIDLAVECAKCNFIVHYKCCSNMPFRFKSFQMPFRLKDLGFFIVQRVLEDL